MNYESGDRIQLSDGNMYTFLFPIQLRGEEYYFLSCAQNEEAFRLGKITNINGEKTISFIFDKEILQEAQEYVKEHENEL